MQPQKAPKSQSGCEKKKNKPGGLTLPDFKANYKATAIKTVWCQQKMRHTDKWNRTEPRNKLTHVWATNFQQRSQKTHNAARKASSTNGLESRAQKTKATPLSHSARQGYREME